MSEINNSGFNVSKDMNVGKSKVNKDINNNVSPKVEEKQQLDAADPVLAALGKSNVKIDNHDMDMKRLLKNPQLAEMSDKMYEAAIRAGISYPDAATFATLDS